MMDPHEISQIAAGDQRTAAVLNIAMDAAAYHRTLLKEGVPSRLAAELTLQAAAFMWDGSGCECEDG